MKSTAKRRSQGGGTMDIILIILGVAILVFTITMIAVFCVYQAVPDTLVQCFFACCGSEGGFMAVIMVAKKITEGRNEEG
jgi:hypothetical protein